MRFGGSAGSVDASTTGGVITLAANGTGTVPAGGRRSTTIINYGTGKAYFSSGTPSAATSPYIPSGASITYGNGSAMNLLADGSGASIGYFGET